MPLTPFPPSEIVEDIPKPKAERDYRHEYVAASHNGASGWDYGFLQQLPTPDDDLENLIGNDVYTRMGNDEQIFASTMLLIMMVLRRPLTLDPAYADADSNDEDFKNGIIARDFSQASLDNLQRHDGNTFKLLFELLWNAMRFGNAVAEKVREPGTGENWDKLVFKKIKVKPRQATAFVVDPYMNLLGLTAYAGPASGWVSSLSGAMKQSEATGYTTIPMPLLGGAMWQFIERDKFVILSLLTENNDPRGRSWWRPIYNPWYSKMRRLKQLDLYAQRFGLPIPKGTTAQDAGDQFQTDAAGNEDRTKPKVSAQLVLLRALMRMQAGDAIAAPYGTEIDMIQNTNDGGSLMGALHYHDSQMVKGITFQKLATSPDAHQAKASGEVHQDVLNSPVHYLKNVLTQLITSDILTPEIELNFGTDWLKYVPKPNLGRIDPEDLARLLTALGTALQSGGLHYSMLPEIWADWGLPPADIETWMEEIKQERAMINASGVPATGLDAKDGQTVANQYAQQEVSRQTTRSIAKRINGRQGAGFHQQPQQNWGVTFQPQKPRTVFNRLWPFSGRTQPTPTYRETVSQNARFDRPPTIEEVLAYVPPEHQAYAQTALQNWAQNPNSINQ